MIIKNGGGNIIGEIILGSFVVLMVVIVFMLLVSVSLDILFGLEVRDIVHRIIDWNNDRKQQKKYKEEVKKDKDRMEIRIFADSKYNEIKHIASDFHKEHEIALSLIEKIFPSPQLTNERYINEVDLVHDKFYEVYDKIVAFLESYPIEDERSTIITDEAIANLNGLYYTLMRLTSELAVLSVETEDIDIGDVQDFVNNVHNYSRGGDRDEAFDRFTKTR